MLKLVEQLLKRLKLAPPACEPRYYINITSGESLAISAFVDGDRFVQVKASEYLNLAPQYASYCAASNDFGAFVPRPLGYDECEGWSIMVTEGIEHTMAGRETVLQLAQDEAGKVGDVAAQLFEFFGRGAALDGAAASHLSACRQSELLPVLRGYFEPTPWAAAAAACIGQAQALGVPAMPEVPQHGDLVFNNLGWAQGRLVVFDWEDYRKVALPGLDIFTLAMSLLDGDTQAICAMATAPGRADAFIARACQLQAITLPLFRSLVPFYMLVFLYLKRNYGVQIQQDVGELLMQMLPRLDPVPGGAARRLP